MNTVKQHICKHLFCFAFFLSVIINFTKAQVCSGSWTLNIPAATPLPCVTGQSIGGGSANIAEPAGCPVNPLYGFGQINIFTFSSPVSSFVLDFTSFSSTGGCCRMEIKINNIFYHLTSANLVDIPSATCAGSLSFVTVAPEGYITGSPGALTTLIGFGRIIINGVNATSVTISTNDHLGIIASDPFDCISVVPIGVESFAGKATVECKAILNWKTGMESGVRNIEVLRSTDGNDFKQVATVMPKGNNSNYTITTSNDEDAYYKLKINDLDGHADYSEMIRVNSNCKTNGYEITPNPVHDFLEIKGLKRNEKIFILDMTGRKVLHFNSFSNDSKVYVQKLLPGMYYLQVIDNSHSKASIKFIKD